MKSSDFDIRIELEDSRTDFSPGDRISGRVIISAPASWNCDYADVALVWHTEGRGDENREAANVETLIEKGENVSPRFERRFGFSAPSMPWSYQGVKLKIKWQIGVYVKARGVDEALAEREFQIHPSHSGHGLPGEPPPP